MNWQTLKNIISVLFLIISAIIVIINIFLRDSEIFNENISNQLTLFFHHTSTYTLSLLIVFLSGIIGIVKTTDFDEENPYYIIYGILQLIFSYYRPIWVENSTDDLDKVLNIVFAFSPTIIFIIRRPIKRLSNLQEQLQSINSELYDFKKDINKKNSN